MKIKQKKKMKSKNSLFLISCIVVMLSSCNYAFFNKEGRKLISDFNFSREETRFVEKELIILYDGLLKMNDFRFSALAIDKEQMGLFYAYTQTNHLMDSYILRSESGIKVIYNNNKFESLELIKGYLGGNDESFTQAQKDIILGYFSSIQ